MLNATFPIDQEKLRSFTGACNVYRRFIEGFEKWEGPLNEMLRKGSQPDWDCKNTEKLESCQDLRDALGNPPVLALPEGGRQFMLDADARKYSMGVTMLKQQSLENE